jgi:hypothetical protein
MRATTLLFFISVEGPPFQSLISKVFTILQIKFNLTSRSATHRVRYFYNMTFMKPSHFLYPASAGSNSDLYSAHVSNRILKYEDPANDSVVVIAVFCMFLFVFICFRKARENLIPSSEILLEQRRRQRELIGQARLRNINIDPDTVEGRRINASRADPISMDQDTVKSRSIELSASEKEKRRSRLLWRFKANNVQTVGARRIVYVQHRMHVCANLFLLMTDPNRRKL